MFAKLVNLFLICLILTGCSTISSQFYPEKIGVVYVEMPKEDLVLAGYNEVLQTAYKKEGNEEWLTFVDWTRIKDGDEFITFHLVDGQIKDWKTIPPAKK